jgi:hypothetical protein
MTKFRKINENSSRSTDELYRAFNDTDAGRDLYALGVRMKREYGMYGLIKYERRGYNKSMPRTAAYKNEDTGKFHIEHYSSKPGLEVYGEKDFDTPEELYRHLWMRLAKNLIPASLISRREAEKKINLETLFPIGHGSSETDFFGRIKPLLGGEELIKPSNEDLLISETVQELIKLELIGTKGYGYGSKNRIISDISSKGNIKYNFYTEATIRVSEIYSRLISQILGASLFNSCSGWITGRNNYESSWTVTNTNRIPLNSVNFRTGENTLRCHVQDVDMMAAVFLSIIKRTFKRARASSNLSERILFNQGVGLVQELNGLLSDYFFMASSNLDPSVFPDRESMQHEVVKMNAHALLIKYLLTNGSPELKAGIAENEDLKKLVAYSTSREDLSTSARKLLNLIKSIKYV